MFYNIFMLSANEKCLYLPVCIYVHGWGCVPANVCMKIAIQQTDSGNQATDSILNLLKPGILLSLF